MTEPIALPPTPEEFEAQARALLSGLEEGQVLRWDSARGPVHVMGEVILWDDAFQVTVLHDDGDDCLEWPPTKHTSVELALMEIVASGRGHRVWKC